MSWGIGFGAERIGLAAFRFPRSATICMFALLILIGVSLPHVSFDDDINRAFLSDSPLSQAQRRYQAQQSPPLSTVLIDIRSPDAFDAGDMTLLRHMTRDLEAIHGVTAVASPFRLRFPPTAETPSGTPVFGPQIDAAFPDALGRFDALETGLPTLVNDLRTAMLISVSIDTGQSALGAAVSGIKAEVQGSLTDGLSANITGEDVISAEIVSGLKDDLVALNLWGALVIALAALALLRDVRMAVLAVIPAMFGAAGVLALSVWLGYSITVLSNVVPILLLVLGVADGVHLVGHLKESRDLRETLTTVGPACALTALTTAVAFASIMVTDNAQLFEFAVLGAIGSMLSFGIVIVTIALLGRRITLSEKPIPPVTLSIAERCVRAGTWRPRVTIAICLLLLAGTTFAFTQTKPWYPLYQNLPDDSPTLSANDAIAKDFGGVFHMILETGTDWAKTRALVDQIEGISPPKTVLSEVNLARWLGHPDMRPTQSELDRLPQELTTQLRGDAGQSRVFVAVPEPMRNKQTAKQFDRLYDMALAAGADHIIGLPTIMRQEAVNLIKQLSAGLVLAALGATLIVAVAFRSFRLVPVLIIPNVLPLMMTGASLQLWADGQLTPTAVLALTISFGIAIDDTVHFLSRVSNARTKGQTATQAVDTAARSAGQVMVLTTLLLTFGLCVTLFSGFTPIRLFGGMMIVTLWAALLIDLMLLPALLTWRTADRDQIAREAVPNEAARP